MKAEEPKGWAVSVINLLHCRSKFILHCLVCENGAELCSPNRFLSVEEAGRKTGFFPGPGCFLRRFLQSM
jgi:hypothetical protein